MRADGTTELVLTNAQQQAIEAAFSINTPDPNTNTNDGSINWTYSIDESDLNFLAHGETVTAVFSITVDDSNGATPSQDITITITGDNDQTTISSGDDSVGVNETNSSISSTGTITITDLDVTDTVDLSVQNVVITGGDYTSQTVPAALTANSNQALLDMLSLTPAAGNELTADPDSGSTFSWTFTSGDSGDSAFNFLAKDETLQLTYTIQSTDSSEALNNTTTNTTTVLVTVTGTNDTPDITIADETGAVTEDANTSASGSTAAQVNTLSLSGSYETGDSVTATVNNVDITYVVTANDNTINGNLIASGAYR